MVGAGGSVALQQAALGRQRAAGASAPCRCSFAAVWVARRPRHLFRRRSLWAAPIPALRRPDLRSSSRSQTRPGSGGPRWQARRPPGAASPAAAVGGGPNWPLDAQAVNALGPAGAGCRRAHGALLPAA